MASECGPRVCLSNRHVSCGMGMVWELEDVEHGPIGSREAPRKLLPDPAQTKLPSHMAPQGNGDTSHVCVTGLRVGVVRQKEIVGVLLRQVQPGACSV